MRGHLFPAVAILEQLLRRGHDVALRALASEVEMLRSLGFNAKPIAAEVEALAVDDWRARSPIGAARNALRTFCDRAEHDAGDLLRAIDQERPDLVLVDVLAWGALGAAEAWAGPWACFSPLPLLAPSRDIPPNGPGLHPARGPLGRARDRLLRPLFQASFDGLARARVNATRASLGLPALAHATAMFQRPPLLLQMTSEGFDYRRADWPENVVMVGPCAWDPPAGLAAELAEIEAPFVLVTTSTDYQNDERLVRVALEALADEPVHVVATLPTASPGGVRAPSNASVLPFASHTPILARAACAVTHGGMGATQKALAQGVPVCAVPFGRDQHEVARRLEVAKAGARLPAWRLNPDRLRTKVREAMAMRSGAEQVARSFAATGGTTTAADALEQQLLQG